MKLRSVFLVFLFGVLGLVEIVNSLCLLKNTARSRTFVYTCYMSTDYLADMKRAPIDTTRVALSNSEIKMLKNGSFTRFGKYLETIVIIHSGVEDIEDNAFQGLVNLGSLGIKGNKLRVIKSSWFQGLSNLKTVTFEDNQIQRIDENFFSTLPPIMKGLDISVNKITCLPVASFGNFYATEFHFRENPLTSMCQATLLNWLKDKKIQYEFDIDYFDTHYDVAEFCIGKFPKAKLEENLLNKCVEETTRDLLPAANGDYTIKQVCESLKDKPSPFLNCTMLHLE